MPKPVKPRSYDSPRRREQASATRRAILASAQSLFVEGGYVGTTIDAIAAHAGVSAETIYATFRNKRSILSALIDTATAGDDAPVSILERPWVQQLRDEPDPRRRVALLARNGRAILERTSSMVEVLRAAASADPDLAALWEQGKAQRFIGQSELLRLVTRGTPSRAGMTLKVAQDVVFAVASPETFRLLTIDRGWTPVRFERWYADTLERLLFDPA